MNEVVLSIDIGTTSTKSILYAPNHEILASQSKGYPLFTDLDGRAEQNPEEIFQTVLYCIKKITKNIPPNIQLKGVVFSSAMHSLIGMDIQNSPITPCITWADNRAYNIIKTIVPPDLGKKFYQLTGTPIHPMSPFAKILWLREENYTLFKQISKFIGIKEYCFYRLFDSYVTDQSIASSTGIFNLHTQKWDKEIIDFLEIDEQSLPHIVDCRREFFLNNSFWQDELNLPADIPFIIGASDGVLANYGSYQITKQKEMLTVGTSGALRTLVDRPILDKNGETFCYMLDKQNWIIGGASNNCGATINWLQNLLNLNTLSIQDFFRIAQNSTPGARGLTCLPYLFGERAPLWNPDATGSFLGMTKNHLPEDFIRSMLESIVYNLVHIYQILLTNKIEPFISIPISGGIAQSDLFCQITADVFNLPVIRQNTIEMSAWGAACLAFEVLDKPIKIEVKLPTQVFNPQFYDDYTFAFLTFKKFQKLLTTF